jgi:hypothetical protein
MSFGFTRLAPVLRQLYRLVPPGQQAFGKIESLVRVRQLAPELVHLEAEAVELLAKVGIGRRTARTVADAVRNGLTEGPRKITASPIIRNITTGTTNGEFMLWLPGHGTE